MGLRLSEEKTLITHFDDGLDFLGWHGYNYPAKKSLTSITGKIRTLCRQSTHLEFDHLLYQLNSVLRGWTTYFRAGFPPSPSTTCTPSSGSASGTGRRKHPRATWKELRRRYCGGGWWPSGQKAVLFDPEKVTTQWYRFPGAKIPSPLPITG